MDLIWTHYIFKGDASTTGADDDDDGDDDVEEEEEEEGTGERVSLTKWFAS